MNDPVTEVPDPQAVSLSDVPLLLGAAFGAAREKGKADWHRMTTAVLKNRLLQMTGRRFDESALGFSSIGDLVAQFPELVRLDHTTRPTTVEFLGGVPARTTPDKPVHRPRLRVRQDLWNAVLNYSAGHEWAWDPTTGQARPRKDNEDALVMPTMSNEDLASLRDAFAAEVSSLVTDEGEMNRIEQWRGKGLGSTALPASLRSEWNERLKSAVVSRLQAWFNEQGIVTPPDLASSDDGPSPRLVDDELRALRALVIDCVRSMTLSELASLNLPAGSILRSRTGHRRRGHDGS